MSRISHLYKVFQALSLDIVAGAVLCSVAISRYYQVPVSYSALACLAIAVWLIYTADHLLDAKKTIDKPATFRHQFHKQYKKPLVIMASLLLLTGVVIACFLPKIILYNGLVGVLLTGIYFLLLQYKSFWQKEVCIATGYTWGIVLAPVCMHGGPLTLVQLLVIPQVFLAALANLLIFSWFDISNDTQDGHKSMVIHWGAKRSGILIRLIIITGILVSLFTMLSPLFLKNTPTPLSFGNALAFSETKINNNYELKGLGGEAPLIMEAILLLMFSLLWLIFKHHTFFRKNDAYRIIGDGIFFIPVLFILYAHQG